MFFSIIVPVYNRPDEIDELLESLCNQSYKDFEVLIIEDGSTRDCEEIVDRYRSSIDLRYFFKENTGQGFSRNFGFKQARGDYFIVFDSDCLIPKDYLKIVRNRLLTDPIDAWGGPDRSHPDFSVIQKAISYAMTSPLTTGGIRGNRKQIGRYLPRSFNMGISKEVFETTGGYKITRMGEDLEFSVRILSAGFRVKLIEEAFVYHKRRTDFFQFFRQLHFFGRARINLSRYHSGQIGLIHLLPACGVILTLIMIALTAAGQPSAPIFWGIAALYGLSIFLHALRKEKSPHVAFLSLVAVIIQITAYGSGFLREAFVLNRSEE